MTRRAAAGAAAALLLALVLATQDWSELPRRVRFLKAFAPKELAVRRLGGSGTAFDRRFFSFLENTRRSLPSSTPGVVLSLAGTPTQPRWLLGNPSYLYLAGYYLAPRAVTFDEFSQEGPPRGWVYAIYGPYEGSSVLSRLPEGVLLGPAPGPRR